MKSTIQRVLFAVAVTALGAGAVGTASAQTTPSSSAPGTALQHHMHGHRHFGGRFVGTLLRATKQLGLSPSEQASIKSVMASNRANHRPGSAAQGPALTVMGNPTSPGFAAAVQSEQTEATARIQKESQLALAIYDSLTPAHQSALPAVLAQMQAKQEARHAAWAAKHATGNG